MSEPIKVLIAEDQTLIRDALGRLLRLERDIELVGSCEDGAQALAFIQTHAVDVLLTDIEMPHLDGLALAEQLQADSWTGNVLVLTTYDRPGYLQRALRAGVMGFVLKESPVETVVDAIRSAQRGHKTISAELAVSAITEQNPLTKREQACLRLIDEGLSTQEIAARIHLAEGTVRNHVSTILSKLHVKSRLEALKVAQEKGWF